MSSGRRIKLPSTDGPQSVLEGADWVGGWVEREKDRRSGFAYPNENL